MELSTTDHNCIDEMLRGFIECAIWTAELEDIGHDVEPRSWQAARGLIQDFYIENHDDLWDVGRERRDHWTKWEAHGHDLWLTGQRHGVGFWDRGYGEAGDRLTKSAEATDLESWEIECDEDNQVIVFFYPVSRD